MERAWRLLTTGGATPDFIYAGPTFIKLLEEEMSNAETRTGIDPGVWWRGKSLHSMILDDPAAKPVKLPPYKTVAVRFIYGHSLEKLYTYRVRKGAKVYLGQEVIVPTKFGKRIAVIVEIHTTKQDTGAFNYLWITEKAGKL